MPRNLPWQRIEQGYGELQRTKSAIKSERETLKVAERTIERVRVSAKVLLDWNVRVLHKRKGKAFEKALDGDNC